MRLKSTHDSIDKSVDIANVFWVNRFVGVLGCWIVELLVCCSVSLLAYCFIKCLSHIKYGGI